jgi:hypothetical protein
VKIAAPRPGADMIARTDTFSTCLADWSILV